MCIVIIATEQGVAFVLEGTDKSAQFPKEADEFPII
jgi:hypothetical protein